MKKRLLVWMLAAFLISMLGACGDKKDNTQETDVQTPNIATQDENVSVNTGNDEVDESENGVKEAEPLETDMDSLDQEEEEETVVSHAKDITGEYTLQFYEFGQYLETVSLVITESEFTMVYPEDETQTLAHSYIVLSDYLLGLKEDGAYTICYYKIEGMEMKMNMLGITSENLVGTYPVYYTSQQSTATIDFQLDGTALEDNQVDADGQDRRNPYEFKYCWYADSDESLLLLVCIDNGYFAYSVEVSENDETLYLTDIGGYTYDLE